MAAKSDSQATGSGAVASPALTAALKALCCCLPPAARLPLAVAVLYGSISMCLALVNKTLLSSHKFECYFTLLSAQMYE